MELFLYYTVGVPSLTDIHTRLFELKEKEKKPEFFNIQPLN